MTVIFLLSVGARGQDCFLIYQMDVGNIAKSNTRNRFEDRFLGRRSSVVWRIPSGAAPHTNYLQF